MIEITILIPYAVAAFLAVNMGASGTAPAFSAAFGARILKKGSISVLFGIFVFAGAILAGSRVSTTIGKEILPPELMTLTLTTLIFLAVSLTLLLCNLLRIPQSTSQTTVFSVAGCALVFQELETNKLFFHIIPSWFILPILAFFITYLAGRIMYKEKDEKSNKKVKNVKENFWIKISVIISSCYVAFAIGANNVGNITGPISSMAINENILSSINLPFTVVSNIAVFLIVPYFGIGSSVLGRNLLKTSGRSFIKIYASEAIIISFVTATLLLIASITEGIPTSLVQLSTGAIFGLGVARFGWKKIFFGDTSQKFLTMWIIAPFGAFLLTVALVLIAKFTGLL